MASRPPQNTTALGIGFGIGVLWLVMAATALWGSIRGYLNQRWDWGLAWALIGLLLLAAGPTARTKAATGRPTRQTGTQ